MIRKIYRGEHEVSPSVPASNVERLPLWRGLIGKVKGSAYTELQGNDVQHVIMNLARTDPGVTRAILNFHLLGVRAGPLSHEI